MTNQQNPLKRKPVQGMDPESLAALNKWAADLRKVAPQVQQLAESARGVHNGMLAAPVWRVAEGQPEAGQQRPQEDPWRMGAPKVNYVDHIDTPGDSHESRETEGQDS